MSRGLTRMANDGTKRNYAFGDLNPFSIKKSQRFFDPHNSNPLHAMREAALENMAGDALTNTGPFVGVVLRVEEEMDVNSPPPESWLAAFFGVDARLNPEEEPLERMPAPLDTYKIRIPEIHAMLPDPDEYPTAAQSSPWHKLINMYPTFIAMDSEALPAKEGDLVWCDFKDKKNFEDPYYIKPVFAEPQPGGTGAGGDGAGDAFDCGGGKGKRGSSGRKNKSGRPGPAAPPGTGLEYLSENAKLALKKSGETYKKFPNGLYADPEGAAKRGGGVQGKNCKADPVHMRLECGLKRVGELTKENKKECCINCYKTHPFPTKGQKEPGGTHCYTDGLIKYMQKGGRGTAKSGKVGVGCASHLSSHGAKMIYAHRLACEDQMGRGYGWGGKSYVWTKAGIDCSGYCYLVRCMTEVMVSSDSKYNAFGSRNFKGNNRKGMGPNGTDMNYCVPSNDDSNLDVHWAQVCYGSGIAGYWAKDRKKKKKAGKFHCKGGMGSYGGYMVETIEGWRRGIHKTVHGKSDANILYDHKVHSPLMPGDQLITCSMANFKKAKAKHGKPEGCFGDRTGTKRKSNNGVTHVLCCTAGADGQLYITESGGKFSGVGGTLAELWLKGHERSCTWAFELEEWTKVWDNVPGGRRSIRREPRQGCSGEKRRKS